MKKILLFFILLPFLGLGQVQIGQDIYGSGPNMHIANNLSISSDGTVLAVYVPGGSENGNFSGKVKVYILQDNNWIQIGQDINGDAQEDNLGRGLSLSSDGSILAVGAPSNDGNGNLSGQVKVFENINNIWIQKGSDIYGLGSFDLAGTSLSLSSDGLTLAIGSPGNGENGNSSGQVRVYNYQANDWVQIGNNINGLNSDDNCGRKVSLSSDGTKLAIASYLSNENEYGAGQIRIFALNNGNWIQMGQNINGDATVDQFGFSVSLSSDGMFVAGGAIANDGDGTNIGYVKVYNYQNNSWTQVGDDIDGEAFNDRAGSAVSLSSDGSVVAIGAGIGGNEGYVRIFKNQMDNWVKVGENIDNGNVISLSSDGSTVGIGTPSYDSINGMNSGRTRVFSLASELALLEIVEDIMGNANGTNITAEQLNSIDGVSGAIDGLDYTIALQNGTFTDPNNPTALEIQAIIDQVNASLSLAEYSDFSFSIYPNPAKNQFTIQLDNPSELLNVSIYNNLGQLVLNTKESIVDSSKLASGLYIVEVETTKGKGTQKLIIE
jgi:hypothetical protein